MGFLRKPGSEIYLMFDDHVFDLVGVRVIKAAKAVQVKSPQKSLVI